MVVAGAVANGGEASLPLCGPPMEGTGRWGTGTDAPFSLRQVLTPASRRSSRSTRSSVSSVGAPSSASESDLMQWAWSCEIYGPEGVTEAWPEPGAAPHGPAPQAHSEPCPDHPGPPQPAPQPAHPHPHPRALPAATPPPCASQTAWEHGRRCSFDFAPRCSTPQSSPHTEPHLGTPQRPHSELHAEAQAAAPLEASLEACTGALWGPSAEVREPGPLSASAEAEYWAHKFEAHLGAYPPAPRGAHTRPQASSHAYPVSDPEAHLGTSPQTPPSTHPEAHLREHALHARVRALETECTALRTAFAEADAECRVLRAGICWLRAGRRGLRSPSERGRAADSGCDGPAATAEQLCALFSKLCHCNRALEASLCSRSANPGPGTPWPVPDVAVDAANVEDIAREAVRVGYNAALLEDLLRAMEHRIRSLEAAAAPAPGSCELFGVSLSALRSQRRPRGIL